MKQHRLSDSGLHVSDLGLGTFEWGHRVDEATAQILLDDFIAAGGNLVELPTSGRYAAGVLGRLRVPEGTVLLARVGVLMGEDDHITIGLGRQRIVDRVDALLTATGRDHLDILVLDVFDPEVDPDETAQALTSLLTLGKIRYVGVSHHTGWQLAEMRRRSVPIVCALAEYSLLERDADLELVPAADYAGVSLIAGAALGRGVLTDKYRRGTPQDSRLASDLSDYVRPYLSADMHGVLAGVRRAATALGVSTIDIALAFNRHRGVASSLVSARTPDQLRQLIESDVRLETEIAEVLDQISSQSSSSSSS